jgi:hypothetical protein
MRKQMKNSPRAKTIFHHPLYKREACVNTIQYAIGKTIFRSTSADIVGIYDAIDNSKNKISKKLNTLL